eukprot:TRINITY_DN3585_c1_g1_i1.p2 TRINITY_DN3585_c1_g1~~TRINITY_DN3585_c1_g1_i1.p2  ORF type:complete len:235 (-),score=22.81 TRINITY_DN3585_c1_g1_i1:345-1010(-)
MWFVVKRSYCSKPSFQSVQRCIATVSLPDLGYDYGALEPYISGEIMKLHHDKHHATYVANYNKALEQYAEAEQKADTAAMIALHAALRFNGGGHVNHSIFWNNLCPPKDYAPPSGDLLEAINLEFGSYDQFVTKFNTTTAAVQGSGWGWLGYNKLTGKLQIQTCPNQDPLSITGLVPLLGIDVWEHAYYLQYKNVRPDYLKAVWNVVNWTDVAQRYVEAKS